MRSHGVCHCPEGVAKQKERETQRNVYRRRDTVPNPEHGEDQHTARPAFSPLVYKTQDVAVKEIEASPRLRGVPGAQRAGAWVLVDKHGLPTLALGSALSVLAGSLLHHLLNCSPLPP